MQNNLLCSNFSFRNYEITRWNQRVISLALYQNQIGKQSTTMCSASEQSLLLYQNQIGKQSTTCDNGLRKFILCQLPEKIDPKSDEAKAGFKTIDQITVKRIKNIIKQHPGEGFQIFK